MELSFDFFSYWKKYSRGTAYGLKRDPFIKTFPKVKLSKENSQDLIPTVIDGTCGTGQDSVRLLMQGYNVIACERSEKVYQALKFAKEELLKKEIDEKIKKIFQLRFSLRCDNVNNIVPILDEVPKIIFFDPMYGEQKGRSALPRKEMQLFHEMVGCDEDAEEVLENFLKNKLAMDKIVVKRSLKLSPLLRKPDYCFKGKSTRFDVYKIFS